jgi:hypothetical protein
MPKDLLIKLILATEKDVMRSMQFSFQKIFDRQTEIYRGINHVFSHCESIDVYRCAFPGCKEVEVWGPREIKGDLNHCGFYCKYESEKFCDAHDKLFYMKQVGYKQIDPVCEKCMPQLLEVGYILTEKDVTHVDKNKNKYLKNIFKNKYIIIEIRMSEKISNNRRHHNHVCIRRPKYALP